ncbi:NfeD family protein [Candidatus Izemoplasma sp. B36]|uniref:NfeD family protein n=1 Tax=Candidatus Izemoplasma sp. B36 TaxID=3242468 RepID=UPI003556CF6B
MMFLSIPTGTLMVLIWVAVIIFAAVVEAGTMDLSSIWFSAGALFALIVALIFPYELWLQVVVFLVVSVLLLVILRPVFKEHMKKNEIKTNADSLIGKVAVCTKEIKDGNRGEVKIEGKIWTAISNEDIELNEKVTVLAIKGVKLVVRKN